MSRITSTICAVLVLFSLGTAVSAQEKPSPGIQPLQSKEKQTRPGVKADFVGVVAQVDLTARTIAVKSRGAIVTFDATSPILKGYRNLEQIKKGDRVALSYTGGGLRIVRTTGTGLSEPEEPARPTPETVKPHKEATKSPQNNRGKPIRMRERANSTEFRDVDNNGDGKISPVELCIVVPDLTIEKFRTYDRNGDGSLSSSEYNLFRKSLPNGP